MDYAVTDGKAKPFWTRAKETQPGQWAKRRARCATIRSGDLLLISGVHAVSGLQKGVTPVQPQRTTRVGPMISLPINGVAEVALVLAQGNYCSDSRPLDAFQKLFSENQVVFC